MKNFLFVAFALLSLTTLAACSRTAPASEPTPTSVPDTAPISKSVSNEEAANDELRLIAEQFIEGGKIRLTVWANQTTLQPEQTLRVIARIENVSNEEVEYTRLSTMHSELIMLSLQDPYREFVALKPFHERFGEQFFIVLDSENKIETLGPGDLIDEEIVWDTNIYGRGDTPDDSFAAPNGEYPVRAAFYIADGRMLEDGQPTLVTVPITVENSWDPAPPDQVVENFLQTPFGKFWFETHTGEGVVRKINGRHYVNSGGWRGADQGAYSRALESTISNTVSILKKDYWLINLYSDYGQSPYPSTVGARADVKTGEILKVFPDLDERFKGGVLATFFIGESSFKVIVKNPETIKELIRIQRGERTDWLIEGRIAPSDEYNNYNWPWNWQLDSEDIYITDSVSGGCEPHIEHLNDLVASQPSESTSRFCPENAVLVDVADFRDKALFSQVR